MQELMKFNFNEIEISATLINGEPWFNNKSICEILDIQNNRDAISRLDEEDRALVLTDTLGGKQSVVFINESGLYTLILSSRKPETKRFKKWVTSEVLPALRKTGSYSVKEVSSFKLPTTFKEALLELVGQVEVNEQLQLQNELQTKELKEAQPHVNYSKNVLKSDNGIRTTIIAKELGMSAEKLNDLLHQKRVQYKQNGTWVLYDKHQDKGYTKTLTVHFTTSTGAGTSHLTVWTEVGRKFIHELVNEKIKTA